MNRTPWAPHEVAFLREWYGVLLVADIARLLRRGIDAVRAKVLQEGLSCRARWTPELNEFVPLLYPDTSAEAIAQVLGVTVRALYTHCKKLGIRKDPAFAAETARRTTLARSPFTPEIVATITRLYATTLTEDLAHIVGIPTARIHAYAKRYGLKKTPDFVREAARARTGPDHPMRQHQFAKGHVPGNKGVKGWQAGGRSPQTQFKKGTLPHTWKPIGSYRVNADGYLDRKVTDTGYPPRDWVAVHRLVWIEAHGEIPDGHIVRFRDGMKTTDPQLLTVERLECISRKEHARRNAWHANWPPELKELKGAQIALTRAINRKQRQLEK
jgi:hypothetical protein